LWNFIPRLKIVDGITRLLKMYCGFSTTLFFSKNDKYSKGAKHMEFKYFVMKEEIHKQSIEHISTNLMIANSLTKSLVPKIFTEYEYYL